MATTPPETNPAEHDTSIRLSCIAHAQTVLSSQHGEGYDDAKLIEVAGTIYGFVTNASAPPEA